MLVSQEDNFKLFDDDPASTIVAGDLMEKKLISIVLQQFASLPEHADWGTGNRDTTLT